LTYCQLFRQSAAKYADKTAVYCKGRRLTYAELEERSNILACRLVAHGVKREDIIGITLGRCVDALVAMLAAWKAGAAYFYHDPRLPQSLLEDITQQCHCPLLIDEIFLQCIDWRQAAPAIDFSAPESLALLIFTSGSTGSPKGVMIEHRNVTAMIASAESFALSESDAFCVFPSYTFVAALSDTFPALLAGSSLYIIEDERRRDINLIIDYFLEHQITISFLPPHMAEKFIEKEAGRTNLRLLLVGSDNMHNLSPQRYEILHVYGASESCSLIADYAVRDIRVKYPVGKVKPGFRYYIVDEDGAPVHSGQEGELWLAGPQVSRGYLNNQPKTMSNYALNPFSQAAGFERVFKTNDIVRELIGGALEFVSRKDNMYKVRGFRVEAGAVESVMLQYPMLKDAVVKGFYDDNGNNILCGFFLANERLDPKAIKVFLRSKLPYYMAPCCIIQLDSFPRNENGKVNRSEFRVPPEINDHKLLEKLY
jgi:amino acid adenylation domain-containing protein